MSPARRPLLGAFLVLAPLGVAPAAWSQVAASASVTTDYLYRGVSLSDGRPALDLSLAYDDKSGFYAGGSVIGEATRHDGLQWLGHQEYAGYAVRLRPDSTLDLGVSNLHYRAYAGPTSDYDATEVYAGWATRSLSYYLHYSPNYFRPGGNALYGEVNGVVRMPRPLRLFGHVGVLTPLGGGYDGKERYDLRAGVAASFRRGEVQLAWTTAQPFQAYADPPSRGRGVVSLGLTWFF